MTMIETVMQANTNDQDIELLEEFLPMLNAKDRAYLKGAAEALIYAQEDGLVREPRTLGSGWVSNEPSN